MYKSSYFSIKRKNRFFIGSAEKSRTGGGGFPAEGLVARSMAAPSAARSRASNRTQCGGPEPPQASARENDRAASAAARSRPRAEGCIFAKARCRLLRSAAGNPFKRRPPPLRHPFASCDPNKACASIFRPLSRPAGRPTPASGRTAHRAASRDGSSRCRGGRASRRRRSASYGCCGGRAASKSSRSTSPARG